jgi:hypothetical protein
LHVPAAILVSVKLAILVVAVVLEVTGHLSGPVATVLTVAVGAFGLQSAVQAFRAPSGNGAAEWMSAMQAILPQLLATLVPQAGAPFGVTDARGTRAPGPSGPSSSPRPIGFAAPLATLALAGALSFGALGCSNPPKFPASTVPDLTAAIACIASEVSSGETDPLAAGLHCDVQEAALARDLWNALTNAGPASPAAQQAVATFLASPSGATFRGVR